MDTRGDVPLGLGMALAQYEPAMRLFGTMSVQQRQEVLDKAKNVQSKSEMRELVADLKRMN